MDGNLQGERQAMPVDFETSRRMIEARAIERNDGPLQLTGYVSFEERISSQPREKFKAHKLVGRTVPEGLRQELDDILGILWQVNEEHVGERTRIAEVAVCSDEDFIRIRDRLVSWSHRFFDLRLGKYNPKDGGNRFRTFRRLAVEFGDVFSCLNLDGSLNYPVFDYLQTFVLWYLYARTFKANMESCPPGIQTGECSQAVPGWAPQVARKMGFFIDDLVKIVAKIRIVGERCELGEIDGLGSDAIRGELAAAASDIREMRPFLVHNFNPTKTLVGFGGDFTLAWNWTLRYGIANVIGGDCERNVLEALESKSASLLATVDYGGRLLDPCRPWSTSEVGYLVPIFGLSESLYVLRRFHEKLSNFYNRVDFDAIRREGTSRAADEDVLGGSTDQVFALSCQDVAERAAPAPIDSTADRPRRRITMLRFRTLLGHLEKSFGCEHRDGKGSEVVVCRRGSKFTLGHHARNPEVSALTVRRLLRQLGISEREWLGSIYRPN